MARFLGRRLIRAVMTVWAVATLVFLLMHALPGDVVLVLLDTVGAGSPAAEKMRQFLGLDRPLHVQYFDWLGDILRGDMGNSLLGGYPVWDLVKSRIPVTVELAALTILLGLSIAIPLGILAAARNGTWVDLLAMQFGQLGISIPNFWIATILILVVAARLQWLPPSGYKPFSDGLGVNLLHMVMPTVSLALPLAAVMTRVVRSAVLEVLSRDYMRVAHAKGLRPRQVLWRHGLKNAHQAARAAPSGQPRRRTASTWRSSSEGVIRFDLHSWRTGKDAPATNSTRPVAAHRENARRPGRRVRHAATRLTCRGGDSSATGNARRRCGRGARARRALACAGRRGACAGA